MRAKTALADSERIRDEILVAAEQRFRMYGYGKTTMAEIASDVNMSAANLYRYFENKLDIGAALTQRCFAERCAILEQVVSQDSVSAAEKLRAFFLANLRYTHAQFSEAPKVNELVDIIVSERSDLIQKKVDNDLVIIQRILEDGVRSGEFNIENLSTTAQAIQHAMVKFSLPLFMTMYPLEEFEQHAKALVGLLVQGLGVKE